MRKFNTLLNVLLLLCLGVGTAFAQSIKGKVVDADGKAIFGAAVSIKGTAKGALVNEDGTYEIKSVGAGTYTLVTTSVGYKMMEQEVVVGDSDAASDFTLAEDLLDLESVIVTGTFNPQSKLESTVSITTLNSKTIEQQAPRSTGDLIGSIPGFYVESNLGETGNNIYPRGLPIGTGSFRYTSLREDGLNNFEISDKVFFNADGFTKQDLTLERVEGLRGGNAVVFASNTPGGIINFVSKTGGTDLKGDIRYTYGTQKMYRADFNVGGPLTEDKRWRFNVGGFYRYDKGLRDYTGPANVGGQVKLNVTRLFDNNKGYVRFYGKVLDDVVAFWSPIPYQGYDDPQPLAGFDNVTKSTFIPSNVGNISLPDPRNPTQSRIVNVANQLSVKYKNIGMELYTDLGDGWTVRNQLKYISSTSQANLIQVVANPNPSINFLLGNVAGVFTGQYTPRINYIAPNVVGGLNYTPGSVMGEAINTNQLSAGLTTPSPALPQGTYAAYAGLLGIPLTDQGINPNGINGNGMLIPLGLFIVPMTNTNLINNLQFTKQAGNHSLTFGAYISSYNTNEYWSFNTILSEVSSNPRLVDIRFEPTAANPSGPIQYVTRGGVFGANFQYEQSDSKNITAALFLGDEWKVNDKLNVSAGFRYELNNAVGALQNTGRRDGRTRGLVRPGSPITEGLGGAGGLDGDVATFYDNNSDVPTQSYTNYNINYEVWGANLGFNLKLGENSALFLNGSRGTRYANSQNFLANKDQGVITGGTLITAANVADPTINPQPGNTANIGGIVNGTRSPISVRNPIEQILQGELGYRVSTSKFGLAATTFITKLTDAPFTLQSTDAAGNIKLDVLLYDVRTIGFELEGIYSPTRGLRFNTGLSLQNAIYTKYPTVVINEVNAADFPTVDDPGNIPETASPADRRIDITDNKVERVPPIQLDFTVDYTISKFNVYANVRYIGARQGNRRNTFELPAFAEFGAGASYQLNNFKLAVQGINIFNSKGITEGNTRTQDNIGPNAAQNNTTINTGIFILPASANFSVTYSF